MRILAIDPSLRGTGYGVIEPLPAPPGSVRAISYGVVANPPGRAVSACLVAIRQRLAEIILAEQPTVGAIESVIYVQSLRTAITLGAARGAALIAMAEAGLPIFEYAPRRIKQSVVGRGAAGKEQVAFMVRALLGLETTPPPDAADALAVALTHWRATGSATARAGCPPAATV